MQRQVIWLLWALASLMGLAWDGYLMFFPVGMQGTVAITATGESVEFAQALYNPVLGLTVSVVLLAFYGLLGLALYARHVAAFGMLAGVHGVLAFLSGASVSLPLYPGSILLILAAGVTIGLPHNDPAPHVEQRHNDG